MNHRHNPLLAVCNCLFHSYTPHWRLFAAAYFTATLHTGGCFSIRSHSNIICPKELILTLITMYNYQASRYSHSLIPLHITLFSLLSHCTSRYSHSLIPLHIMLFSLSYPTVHHAILTLLSHCTSCYSYSLIPLYIMLFSLSYPTAHHTHPN